MIHEALRCRREKYHLPHIWVHYVRGVMRKYSCDGGNGF
ncbi:hypothetical protein PP914_gp199 [Arthrobacter phage Qui]|uniref:Uncharacterized protein n=1 Tax=Arthrobacter phage Qui TaxID=2603260 RepID=A0A5B8WIU7_9CAUD|nr:hypothetical protein PP914_gp199 [Arthrobacter phage Qui]QED11687.1 hypothetical protein SEA_QUI_199 [Arthrobacter phage Qui]QOC56518.1 hypothetical protein SEA_PAELLA_199 [Arthrobacter phage Paella]